MGRTKNWTAEEIAAACKAYCAATENAVQGADMRVEDFNDSIIEKFRAFSPPDPPIGTFHMCISPFFYLRNNVFGKVHKFNKAIRLVNLSEPTGVTDDKKLRMSVAILMEITMKMDYKWKSFDPNEWKLYKSWLVLKNCQNFSSITWVPPM